MVADSGSLTLQTSLLVFMPYEVSKNTELASTELSPLGKTQGWILWVLCQFQNWSIHNHVFLGFIFENLLLHILTSSPLGSIICMVWLSSWEAELQKKKIERLLSENKKIWKNPSGNRNGSLLPKLLRIPNKKELSGTHDMVAPIFLDSVSPVDYALFCVCIKVFSGI